MGKIQVGFRWLNERDAAELALPTYETARSAGMDVRLAIDQDILLEPGEIKLLPTGFALSIPAGYEVQVRPRSGLAVRHGITLVNSPGTIDADYRGEVKIGLINLSKNSFLLKRGDRVAQLILAPLVQAEFEVVQVLDETKRGDGGFGSTGLR